MERIAKYSHITVQKLRVRRVLAGSFAAEEAAQNLSELIIGCIGDEDIVESCRAMVMRAAVAMGGAVIILGARNYTAVHVFHK
jgi:hypothetical protein